ncbi:MAG TPA: cysteine-rich CWC family protein [Ramlibacter sp.]|uniref:cysteine-rich CWC family protein n=1 Tax=Ramlibacter sp. TaxID=1917967 RepID=UPI002D7431A3|nr:cysteine-rich CWC family protein [Ramlibacter sp.]HZY17247.1 cysteine-rich CWC family protein [Ramlibacter sp.]
MSTAATPSPVMPATACPLCGADNRCAMESQRRTGHSQPPCWCTRASFPPDLLARVPEEARARACICPGCAGATGG